MKVRTDFVTNSSSSSFVLAFESEDSIKREVIAGMSSALDGSALQRTLISDIENAERMTKEQVREIAMDELEYDIIYEMETDYVHHKKTMTQREFNDWKWAEGEDFQKDFNERINRAIKNIMETIENSGVVVMVEYEDHDEIGSMLEHDVLPYHSNSVCRFNHH